MKVRAKNKRGEKRSPAPSAQECNDCGANRRLKKLLHLQGVIFRDIIRGRMLFAWFLFLHSLLMPLLEKGYWTAGTFIPAVFMLPPIFVNKIVEDKSKAASGMRYDGWKKHGKFYFPWRLAICK